MIKPVGSIVKYTGSKERNLKKRNRQKDKKGSRDKNEKGARVKKMKRSTEQKGWRTRTGYNRGSILGCLRGLVWKCS